MKTTPSVLITDASSDIGAAYAERFASRGHDLVLVGCDRLRMDALATHLRQKSGVAVDVIPVDLTQPDELAVVEARLREDRRIGVLVNNAGMSIGGHFLEQQPDDIERLVALNTIALVRLARAVSPRFAAAGEGAIINIGSVIGLAPEFGATVYGATKAFVLFLSQGLSLELAPSGVYVQAVLPAATPTEIGQHADANIESSSVARDIGAFVEAALIGFDNREPVTIPPLQEFRQWTAYQYARQAMLPIFAQAHPAIRYRLMHSPIANCVRRAPVLFTQTEDSLILKQ
ncbi:SDR family NAD(P)-dependent oxidoreductase [Dickeya lacustris]|uniref:SDR family oxidoreductase n=1 Tax=Dickeya lacustris TaxID=2259638 RepID=A0ABY8GB86_9GAMM|nr:SDR family oxidoreductase [Dickeya lacustris]WFN57257.1 SDR family oxidoreductase [Dickeya lacustris]